ncbi:MAG: ParA family protein [Magnetococcales bacterium]|nr:ParA family protein [Magnetococcales bacterium]
MYAIAIYNNKGGVGKSTLTVFMADFLATLAVRGRPLKVVVLDLDPQGSSSAALLGRNGLHAARTSGHTLGNLAEKLERGRPIAWEQFLFQRPNNPGTGRARAIVPVDVMVTDREQTFAFETNPLHRLTTLRERLRPELARRYDLALLDLPGNIDPRHLLAVNGLIFSDAVLTPVEVSRFSIDAMPATLDMIAYARTQGDGVRPVFLGMVLNRVDKRGQQYQRNIAPMQELSSNLEIPLFEQILPHAQALTTATDQDLAPGISLRERYGGYYPHVKAVVGETLRRWHALEPQPAGAPG